MNPLVQPDTHPDADLLNAFVEHALSSTERAQIVAHMAGCARCREVVYLARAAAEPEMVVENVPAAVATKPERARTWFTAVFARWQVVLIPAAALAAVGGVVLWVQLHPVAQHTEMAQLAPPRLESPAPVTKPPQPGPQAAERKPAVAAPLGSSGAIKPGSAERPPANAAKKVPPAAEAAQFSALSGPAGQIRLPAEIHLDGRSAAMAQSLARQSPATTSAVTDLSPQERQEVRATPPDATVRSSAVLAAPPSGIAPSPPARTPGILAVQNEIAAPPVNGFSRVATQSLQQAEPIPQAANRLPVLQLAKRARLPSGLNTVSSAVLLNRLVVVDAAGSVFLSEDGGRSWEPVFAQWAGKAVEVQAPSHSLYRLMPVSDDRSPEKPAAAAQASLSTSITESAKEAPAPAPAASAMNSTPALPAKAKAARPHPDLLFKLVTDRHQVWVSPDGKVWREQ